MQTPGQLDPGALDAPNDPWLEDLKSSAARLGAGLWAGLLVGLFVGGTTNRLAMFVLRLTSDPSVLGRTTDDGFIIGEFTADTGFLVLLSMAVGGLAGLFYLVIRPWLPERNRWLFGGLFGAAVGGSLIVHPGGIDFTVLEPLWLAVAMFVAIPALYGIFIPLVADRLLDRRERRDRPLGWFVLLLPLGAVLIGGLPGIILIAASMLGWAIDRKVVRWIHLWRSVPMVWIGRAALVGLGAWATVALVSDITQIV